MMRKLTILLFTLIPLTTVSGFSDVSTSPYREAITELAKTGIVQGYSDNTYKPQQSINRAEFIKILMATKYQRQVDYQAQSDKSCFSDIPSPVWYRPYACVAQTRKVIDGYADGSFKAANTVNKAEAAKILYQFYFDDPVKLGSPWYLAYYEGLENKRAFFTFFDEAADSPLTRGQMAFAIQQLEQYPAVALAPAPIETTTQLAFNQPVENTPVVDVTPTPLPAPAPVSPAIEKPSVTFPAVPSNSSTDQFEVSPLYVVESRHPGPQVSGGYISSYSQWQRANYAASQNNVTLSREEAHRIGNLVLKSVNDARVAAGKDRMRFDPDLQDLSQNFAEHLVINAVYSHSDKLGNDPFERAKIANIPGFVAESIVWRRRDPETAIGWWKNSAVHWNNVSNSRFTKAGVGVTKEPNSGYLIVMMQGEWGLRRLDYL